MTSRHTLLSGSLSGGGLAARLQLSITSDVALQVLTLQFLTGERVHAVAPGSQTLDGMEVTLLVTAHGDSHSATLSVFELLPRTATGLQSAGADVGRVLIDLVFVIGEQLGSAGVDTETGGALTLLRHVPSQPVTFRPEETGAGDSLDGLQLVPAGLVSSQKRLRRDQQGSTDEQHEYGLHCRRIVETIERL